MTAPKIPTPTTLKRGQMSDPDLSQRFGHLEGLMTAISRQMSESDREASASRAKLYAKVEKLAVEMQETRSRVQVIEKTLDADVRPVIRSVTDWKARAAGGVLVIGIIGSALMAAVWALWELVLDGVRNHLGGR